MNMQIVCVVKMAFSFSVSKRNLTEEECGAVLVGALMGLGYLHSFKVIHRDMKAVFRFFPP